jgi:hypothetical protein
MDNIGPQKRPKSLRAVEAESKQTKAMFDVNEAVEYTVKYATDADWSAVTRAMEIFKSSGSIV